MIREWMVLTAFLGLAAIAVADEGDGTGGNPEHAREVYESGHVLNRTAYGPTARELRRIHQIGLDAYLQEQMRPHTIDESGNTAMQEHMANLFTTQVPYDDRLLVAEADVWFYRKGDSEPPADWTSPAFDDSGWAFGQSGFGFGDYDDRTVFEDMEGNYLSIYLRKKIIVTDPSDITELIFRVSFDDGFVFYINGNEVVRENIEGSPPPHDAEATEWTEAWHPYDFQIDPSILAVGENTLAIQVHNVEIDSSDVSMIPELIARSASELPPREVIRGARELQQMVHVRGVYSERQLEAVMAEFWENHFTTDLDKVGEVLQWAVDSDGTPRISWEQSRLEAAQIELAEYEFFRHNALGSFADLLLFSATSPSMLLYLDGVANGKFAPNENYAREVLELHCMGVDNGYEEQDIWEIARCFTGWTITKVDPRDVQEFPDSALHPPTAGGLQFEDHPVIHVGENWQYFKGTGEPSPGEGGVPTLDWTQPGFVTDGNWLTGPSGFGYGDDDDNTVLDDMRDGYVSVYVRKTFDRPDPIGDSRLVFAGWYDDGIVVYLNGVEVGRSWSMEDRGAPPPYHTESGGHEVTDDPLIINLTPFRGLLQETGNVLAVQGHNYSLGSSDFSLIPVLVERAPLPGGMELSNPNGTWVFRFDPDNHDDEEKTIFEGKPYEINLEGDGLRDGLTVLRRLAYNPHTAEFICLKLIHRFISDEISLETYRDGTAPAELRTLFEEAIAAWMAGERPGDIRKVMKVILGPSGLQRLNKFYKVKVKTPVEFVNSSIRVIEADLDEPGLPEIVEEMGMHLFTRDAPDGWDEDGNSWVNTNSLLEQVNFVSRLAANRNKFAHWDALAFLERHELATADEIIDFLDQLLYQSALSDTQKQILRTFLTTNHDGNPSPLVAGSPDYEVRVRTIVGLMLSMPQWLFQ